MKCHILTLQDNGENGISSSSANLGRSVEHWRRLALLRSGDVEPNPGPPQVRSRGGREFLCVVFSAEIAAKFSRALDICDFFLFVARSVCCLLMDVSSLSRLPRVTWNRVFGLTNRHLVLQELWSLLCVDSFCLQFFSTCHLQIPLVISVFCGDCIYPGYSQYHQSPVRLWTSNIPSSLPFSSQSRRSRLAVLEFGRVESPPSVDFDPDVPCQETEGACLLNNTRNPLQRHVCPQLSWHDISVGTRFEKIGSVIPEVASFLLSIGAKNPALKVSEKVQALERAASRNLGRGENPTFSRLRAVRHLGVVDSLFKFCVNAIAYHIATGSGTSIAGSSCSGRPCNH